MKRKASQSRIEVRYHHHDPPCLRTSEIVSSMPSDVWQMIFTQLIFSQPVNPGARNLLSAGAVCLKWNKISSQLFREHFFPYKEESANILKKFTEIDSLKVPCDKISYSVLEMMTNLTRLKILACPDSTVTSFDFLDKLTKLQSLHFDESDMGITFSPFICSKLSRLSHLFCGISPHLTVLTQLRSLGVYPTVYNHNEVETKINFENFLSHFSNLTELLIFDIQRSKLTNQIIQNRTNLKTLKILSPSKISDEGLSQLTNLTKLTIEMSLGVSANSLSRLTNLEKLDIGDTGIENQGIKFLTNLKFLNFEDSDQLNEEGLLLLTNLEALSIGYPCNQNCIKKFTKLKKLKMIEEREETESVLASLPNLTSLDISGVSEISDRCFSNLTNLKELDISERNDLTTKNLTKLTNLTALRLVEVGGLKDEDISCFTNLVDLDLPDESKISKFCLKKLPFLLILSTRDKRFRKFDCLENCYLKKT